MHLQNGAIKVHYEDNHNETIDRNTIVQCTKIEHRENDTIILEIRETLLILHEKLDQHGPFSEGLKQRFLQIYGRV